MRWLVDEAYPLARVIRVVLDNLKTHIVAALYATFAAPEANRLRKRLEFHYTPKHGSWLNMTEIEFSIFARQAWQVYVPDEQTLCHNVHVLETECNTIRATVHWLSSSQDAHVKLHRLYPPSSV